MWLRKLHKMQVYLTIWNACFIVCYYFVLFWIDLRYGLYTPSCVTEDWILMSIDAVCPVAVIIDVWCPASIKYWWYRVTLECEKPHFNLFWRTALLFFVSLKLIKPNRKKDLGLSLPHISYELVLWGVSSIANLSRISKSCSDQWWNFKEEGRAGLR